MGNAKETSAKVAINPLLPAHGLVTSNIRYIPDKDEPTFLLFSNPGKCATRSRSMQPE
jgi:hypothetical protein